MSDQINEIINMSWVAVQSAIQTAELSVADLTSAYLAHISVKNPEINALRHVMADRALAQAGELDRKIKVGEILPPLAGLPVVIKENCDVENVPCSAGLSFRNDHIPATDSAIAKRLRDLGAIVLGISVSDPGAFDVRTREVKHPFDRALTVGGSSGGSGAALAAKMCLAAIGTDTGGSIRIPSACCGMAGLKPTFNALSMDGIFPLVQSLDHVGPMAQSVKDLAVIWSALFGQPTSETRPVKTVGFARHWINEVDPDIQDEFAELEKTLSDLDIKLIEIDLPDLDAIVNMHLQIFIMESAAYHLARYSNHLQSYPQIAKDGFDAALASSASDYINACQQRISFTEHVVRQLNQVDVLITPTLPCFQPMQAADELCINGKSNNFTAAMVRHTCLFNHTGHPALAMPFPNSKNNFTSFQIIGSYHQEQSLISLGKTIEAYC